MAGRYVPGRGWLEPGVFDDSSDYAFAFGPHSVALTPAGTGGAVWMREFGSDSSQRETVFSRYR